MNKLCAWRLNIPPTLSSPRGRPAPRTPPSRRNVAVVSHAQYVLTVTTAPASRVKAAVSKAAWWPWPFDLESGVWVTCDVGYLPANFGLSRPLCSRLRPDVRDRQTSDVKQHHRLLPLPIRGWGIIIKLCMPLHLAELNFRLLLVTWTFGLSASTRRNISTKLECTLAFHSRLMDTPF